MSRCHGVLEVFTMMLEDAQQQHRYRPWKPIAFVAIIIVIAFGTILAFYRGYFRVAETSVFETVTDQNGIVGSLLHHQFPSSGGATASFDQMLNGSRDYRNYIPCFDDRGNRIGEKATMFIVNPDGNSWRTVWTLRKTNSSELFYINAETLDGVLALEKTLSSNESRKEGWRFCKATRF